MESEEPLPCLACGSTSWVWTTYSGSQPPHGRGAAVGCKSEICLQLAVSAPTRAGAVAAWNARQTRGMK